MESQDSQLLQVKRALKRAAHLRNAGELERSEVLLTWVFADMSDHGDKTVAVYYYPRTCHQMALTLAAQGELDRAVKLIKIALESFEASNYLGRGRATRTYGWLLHQQGRNLQAVKQLQLARHLVCQDTGHSKIKRTRELLITDGLLAYCDPGLSHQERLATMQRVDAFLRDGPKWQDELDNLRRMIPLLSLLERPFYMARAARLKRRIMIREDLRVLVGDITNRDATAGLRFGWRLMRHVWPPI